MRPSRRFASDVGAGGGDRNIDLLGILKPSVGYDTGAAGFRSNALPGKSYFGAKNRK
jgi:hypothetical protein